MNKRIVLAMALIGTLATTILPAFAGPGVERPAPAERASAPAPAPAPERASAPEPSRASAPERSTQPERSSQPERAAAPEATRGSFPDPQHRRDVPEPVQRDRHDPRNRGAQDSSSTSTTFDNEIYAPSYSTGIGGARLPDERCYPPNEHRLFGNLFGRKPQPCKKTNDPLPAYASPTTSATPAPQ